MRGGICRLACGFQSTHPRGVRPRLLVQNVCNYMFQSTHPRGVRHGLQGTAVIGEVFQSTHPRGVRRQPLWLRPVGAGVSIHAPAWGATLQVTSQKRLPRSFNPRTRVGCDPSFNVGGTTTTLFQSTHPRGVRRYQNRYDEYRGHVSIHAPAWGATSSRISGTSRSGRFQSTHPRGVRRPSEAGRTPQSCFNPRTRVGCDGTFDSMLKDLVTFQSTHPRGVRHDGVTQGVTVRKFQSTHPRGVRLAYGTYTLLRYGVSIHAPAWGATMMSLLCGWDFRGFNPRTRVGCDEGLDTFLRESAVSIHAPAWGATRSYIIANALNAGFNPRTRVGCDHRSRWLEAAPITFQSTHPRGVRHVVGHEIWMAFDVSIHAPAWGATSHAYGLHAKTPVSIHAPAWGATRRCGRHWPDMRFQSTHPRGVRRG